CDLYGLSGPGAGPASRLASAVRWPAVGYTRAPSGRRLESHGSRRTWMSRSSMGVVAAVAAALVAVPAHAQWKTKGELGGSIARGNSESESVNGAIEITYTRDKWEHVAGFAGNYGDDGTIATAQRWEVRGQSNYTFNEKAYWFGAARYEDDRFSSFDSQASLSTGLGYKFNDTERTKFRVQGGPGYRYANVRETGETEDGVIFRGDVDYEHQLTDTTKIVDKFLVERGSENTYLQNDLGIEVTIMGALGLRVGFHVPHNT